MELISTLTAIFLAASITLLIFDRFNHPAIPAYIIAGLIAGYFIEPDSLIELAQLGIAFLIFIFGLKFDPKRLLNEAKTGINTASLQILSIGLIAYASGTIIGLNSMDSVILAAASGLSSSLVGLQLTEQEIQLNLLHGRISETVHLIQDVIGLFLLAVIFALTVESALYALGATALVLLLALFTREYVFDFVAEQADYDSELMMLSGLTALVGFISLTQFLELPMVIGAFAAGLTAAKFPHNMELLDTMGSIKDFFSAIFFVALGALVTSPRLETLAVAGLIILFSSVINSWIVYRVLTLQNYDSRTAMLSALSLDQVSEISLVIAIQAFLIGAVSDHVFQGVILGAAATMVISSYTKKYEEEIYQKLRPGREVEEPLNIENHVILVGYHMQGERILEHLQEEGVKVSVIDNDPEKVSTLKEHGIPAVYGDVMDMETWIEANYSESQLIVSTVPSQKVSEKIVGLDTPKDKIVRASNAWEAVEHLENGALHCIVPDIASSELLIDHIEGMKHNENYREKLRRESLLELRKYLNS